MFGENMKVARLAGSLFLLSLSVSSDATAEARPSLRAALDAQLESNAKQYGIPAQSVLILRNGEVLYRNQSGLAELETQRPVRADDVYAVYSVSKLFVSTLVLQLVDRGRIDIEAPASRYVVNLPAAWHRVRIDQLLNHASGLPDFFADPDASAAFPPTRDALINQFGDRPLDFEPGTQTRYNQTNYVILQAVLEAVHGLPYREIVRTRIVEPLGLRDVYLGHANAPKKRLVAAYVGKEGRIERDRLIPWQDYSIAHAELFTTPDDLGRFLTAVASGKFARPETLLRLWQPYRLTSGETGFASGWDNGEAGGWRDVGLDGGVKVRVRLLFRNEKLDDSYVIIYLTNGTRDNVWTRTLVESLQQILLARHIAKRGALNRPM